MPRETMRWLPMVGRLLLPCEFSASTSTVRPIWPFLFHSAFFVLLRGPNLASSVQGHSGLHNPKTTLSRLWRGANDRKGIRYYKMGLVALERLYPLEH